MRAKPLTLGLEISIESGERCYFVGIEDKPHGLMATAIAPAGAGG
mgnify:CR=1 FL=1